MRTFGALFSGGGTLGIAASAPTFEAPAGFEPRGVYHMTLLDIADSKMIRNERGLSSRAYEAWLDKVVTTDAGPDGSPLYVGVGYVEQGENAVYFEIYDWPEAQKWRADRGLGPKDFHVTIAVRGKDIHGVRKDRSTLIK